MTLDAELRARLLACIGDEHAADIEPEEQVELTLELLDRAGVETREEARAMNRSVGDLEVAAGVLLLVAASFFAGWKMGGEADRDRLGQPYTPSYLAPVERPRRRRPIASRLRW